ncbi:hypothetical protein CGCA056_v009008 [Colletotrichum aenigma]|uniref:uncharacterized protein n=1 Tax=Colletotrichum aenigma TaxID=1215731 RepID=UPI001872E32A|nr:uncharacterized protein CGCA056_v009008 [Colletotrichum aenigma]KAF5520448.1 hypothetical protein CGCA056_v009008 [Colletotrichum aenigma]
MLISMLDHQLKGGDYSSALLSALAVIGIAENSSWVQITDYTIKYSAVVKVACMLVIHQGWKNNQAASIIFVTPELAVTKGFRDFIAQLEGRQALDCVVVDECHVVLEGSQSFQLQLRELGEVIRKFGVQTICLTATLTPTDEAAFFYVMRLEASCWVSKLLAGGRRGKAVMYAISIERVERLGLALGCAIFFSDVDSTEGKAAQLKAWRQSNRAEGVMVATNALGLSINILDVQLMIYADMLIGL